MAYCVDLLLGHGFVFASNIHANIEQRIAEADPYYSKVRQGRGVGLKEVFQRYQAQIGIKV